MLPYSMFVVFRCRKWNKHAFTGSRVLKAAINDDHMIQEQVCEEERLNLASPGTMYLSEKQANMFWTWWFLLCQGVNVKPCVENLYTDFFKSLNKLPYNCENSTWGSYKRSVAGCWTLMLPTLCANACTYPDWVLLPTFISGSHCLSELSILPPHPHASYLSPSPSVSLLPSFISTNIWYTNGSNYHCWCLIGWK